MQNVNSFLKSLEVCEPQRYKNLTVFPLKSNLTCDCNVLTVEEADIAGVLDIVEVGEGNVPHLRVINRGVHSVLLPEGSILRGNRQDRTVIMSVVLNAMAETVIDVRCCEQGRWNHTNVKAATSANRTFTSLRKESYKDPAQHKMWALIRKKQSLLKAMNSTHSTQTIYDNNADSIEGYQNAFRIEAEHIGMIVAVDEHILGMELYGSQGMFKKQFSTVISGYAVDALDKSDNSQSFNTVGEFLNAVARAKKVREDESHIGVKSKSVVGRACFYQDTVIHMASFAV